MIELSLSLSPSFGHINLGPVENQVFKKSKAPKPNPKLMKEFAQADRQPSRQPPILIALFSSFNLPDHGEPQLKM